jgi:hypothetical protein
MEQQDVERIARAALRELGLPKAQLTIAPIAGRPGYWDINIHGHTPSLKIRCGKGSSPQWVRDQIFDQYNQ